MKILINICIVLVALVSFSVEAFQKQEIRFSLGADQKPDVSFVFTGLILKEPIDLLNKGVVKDAELKKIHAFFQQLYEANRNGGKSDVLAIWNPDERKELDKSIDAKGAEQNKARFQALSGMSLKMIIEYAAYYICYVQMDFSGEKSFVMKYPILKAKDHLYLTNKLNGDYFYDNISHLLDKAHYQMNMQ